MPVIVHVKSQERAREIPAVRLNFVKMETSYFCMKVGIIPLNVNWAIIQLLCGCCCPSDSGGAAKSAQQPASRPFYHRIVVALARFHSLSDVVVVVCPQSTTSRV